MQLSNVRNVVHIHNRIRIWISTDYYSIDGGLPPEYSGNYDHDKYNDNDYDENAGINTRTKNIANQFTTGHRNQ